MLKQSVSLLSAICALGLCCQPQIALASEVKSVANTASNSVTHSTSSSVNAVSKPLRLEINLSRRRVTLYEGSNRIKSYPIAIGRKGWETPTGNFEVMQMLEKPTWIHPLTGESIPGGHPENPLGNYWIGFWTDGTNWVGFHGTPNPESVGKAVSHGCVRMYNNDVAELFRQVSLGTPVTVVQ